MNTYQGAYDGFDDFVNEVEPTVTIMGYDYNPARALRELDPIAYRQEFLNWADALGIDTDTLTGNDRMVD